MTRSLHKPSPRPILGYPPATMIVDDPLMRVLAGQPVGRVVVLTRKINQPDHLGTEITDFSAPPEVGAQVAVVVVPEHPGRTAPGAADALAELVRWRRRLTSDGKNTFTLGGDLHLEVLDHAIAALGQVTS